MQSCLYECRVMHHRFSPRAHRFDYRIFLFGLDLDELDTLDRKLRFFSVNRGNLYAFNERDFLPTHEAVHNQSLSARTVPSPNASLKARVLSALADQGLTLEPQARVILVTLPRILGYLFNPVSFYFCFDGDGQPVAALAEVTNTFREVKPFFLGPDCRRQKADRPTAPFSEDSAAGQGIHNGITPAPALSAGRHDVIFSLRVPKHFYVSPYSDVDVEFDFKLPVPSDRLAIQIDDYASGERTLTSTLRGPRRPLTDWTLAWYTIKYPLLTLWIIALIHWHALRLYVKKTPWFRKAARSADQRDLYRPHFPIATHPDA